MKYEVGQFLKAPNGIALEVVYADEEKAVCLKIKHCHEIGWLYMGESIAVSNALCDYEAVTELKRIPTIEVNGKYQWEPLKATLIFPMI